MDNLKMSLADLRKINGLTQRDLASCLNISSSAIGMYESGKRIPSLKLAIKIADFFNVPVEQISFSDMEEKKKIYDSQLKNISNRTR